MVLRRDAAFQSSEVAGQRYVDEFNPSTGIARGWNETLDQAGNIR